MNRSSFLSVVPRAMKVAAWIVGSCCLLAGVTVAVANRYDSPFAALLYSLAGLIAGTLLSTWVLGIGFVHADAQRRAMRPGLWTVVVILFPHLLGFLLYFVLRQPLASPCPYCGQPVPQTQRFCSWCGALRAAPPSAYPTAQTRVGQ